MTKEDLQFWVKLILGGVALIGATFTVVRYLDTGKVALAATVVLRTDFNHMEDRLDSSIDREYKRWQMDKPKVAPPQYKNRKPMRRPKNTTTTTTMRTRRRNRRG